MRDIRKQTGAIGSSSGVAAAGGPALGPGKRSLTEAIEPAPPAGAAPARHASPPRVADATEAEPNAALRVLVYNADGEVIQRWESKGHWEGTLPEKYTATRNGKEWAWDNTGGPTIRIHTARDGRGGVSVEAWAKAAGVKIVVHAYAVDAVTSDEHARGSDQAPGHAKDPRDAGDGATTRMNPGGVEHGRPGREGHAGGAHGAGDRERERDGGERSGERREGEGEGQGARQGEGAREREAALNTAAADPSSDAFERDLGIDPAAEALEDDAPADALGGGETPGGEGSPGGVPEGRTGDDTRVGGTGPGGPPARADGQGADAKANGQGGAVGGDKDGQQGGVEGGMYGGEGKPGADGVPSGIGLFGGLIGIPAALKGLVELALIVADGDITGAGADLFRKGLGKIASAAAARRVIASEARRAAVKETKAAIQAIKADKVRSAAWNAATRAERETMTRRIYWELQRTYFDAYRKAAQQAKREARAALSKSAGNAAAQQRLKHAELAEEATDVMPVAGRLPQNHDYAGQAFPPELLPPKYRSKGLQFTKDGYPDFAPHARQLPNGKNHVEIEYTGSRRADEAVANKKAKLDDTPKGWTWHHAEDMKTMYLVPDALHEAVRHSGGVAKFKHGSGIPKYGD